MEKKGRVAAIMGTVGLILALGISNLVKPKLGEKYALKVYGDGKTIVTEFPLESIGFNGREYRFFPSRTFHDNNGDGIVDHIYRWGVETDFQRAPKFSGEGLKNKRIEFMVKPQGHKPGFRNAKGANLQEFLEADDILRGLKNQAEDIEPVTQNYKFRAWGGNGKFNSPY